MSTEITPRNAANVLWTFGEGGYPGNGFTIYLLRCIEQADSVNLARLALGFPGLVAAWRLAHDTNGIERLRSLADREDGHDETFGEPPAHVEAWERVEYATRWTGFEGALMGAPLTTQISGGLRQRHVEDHAEEIKGWQREVGITPDAEAVSRTLLCAATPWEPLASSEKREATR